jgi:hypothetical protein
MRRREGQRERERERERDFKTGADEAERIEGQRRSTT